MQNSTEFLDRFFADRVLKKAIAYSEADAEFLRTLMRSFREGHLCLVSEEQKQIPGVIEEGADLFPKAPIVKHENRYYLQRNWVYETYILEQVERLRRACPSLVDESPLQKWIDEGKLLPLQAEAISNVLKSSFSLICGGPGTGKTYTAGFLVRLLCHSLKKGERLKVAMAAPTGKAAAHLQSALLAQGPLASNVEMQAATLHRLLRLQPGENRLFTERKIDADLVLVDEASMIDVPLFAHLLEAVREDSRLVLMGDPDQLPPVEAGSLFADMAEIHASFLRKSVRTNEAHLQRLAKAIQEGKVEEVEGLLGLEGAVGCRLNWVFDETLPKKLFEALSPRMSFEEMDPTSCLKAMEEVRVLCALRQGMFGTDALNRQILQEMRRRIKPGQWWAVPILVTSNEPRLDLYNGSCGVCIGKGSLDLRQGKAFFPGIEKSFKAAMLPPFEAAFCLSIHKSQGSEFGKVIALFPSGSENFGRESIYTAVTRAKRHLEVAIDRDTLRAMLARRCRRVSGFALRLLRSSA